MHKSGHFVKVYIVNCMTTFKVAARLSMGVSSKQCIFLYVNSMKETVKNMLQQVSSLEQRIQR